MLKISFKKLSEIAEVFNGVRENRYVKNYTLSQKVYQLERPTFELSIDSMELSKDIDDKYYSKKGDLIINLAYPYQIFLLNEKNIIIPSKFAIIRLYEGYDSNYIYQLLKNKKKIFSKAAEGSVLSFLKVKDLKDIKLDLPDFKQQKKQGEILKLIDEKIRMQMKLIENEINFKKSVLGESDVRL